MQSKIKLFSLLPALLLAGFLPQNFKTPNRPSSVSLKGATLMVRDRKPDGSLQAEQPYIIKGVCWSPSGPGTPNDYFKRIEEFGKWYRRDIELISKMNANTVYTFLDFGDDPNTFKILDFLYQHHIKAIVTVDLDGSNDLERIKQIVPKYKNHPAILMWAIGNEWNINLYHHKFSNLWEAATTTEVAARLIKTLDPNHPVASIFGEIIIQGAQIPTPEIVNKLVPTVDVWGLNIYRGDNFGDLFDYWRSFSAKPIFIAEFGTDSIYSDSWWPVKGHEDLEMQKKFVASLWKHLSKNLSACDPQNPALGGTVFEWQDEWWKVKPSDGGSDYAQELNGFPTPWNKFSHPDGFGNEEFFGIVRIDRTPKPLYEEFKSLYGLDPCH
jgi:glycosyl hydrolase family 2